MTCYLDLKTCYLGHFIGCCPIIKISLANRVQRFQPRIAGTYTSNGTINGRTYWVKATNDLAIWYIPRFKDWAIGSLTYLGTTMRDCETLSELESECPDDNRLLWGYWNGNSWEETSDIEFDCQGKKE